MEYVRKKKGWEGSLQDVDAEARRNKVKEARWRREDGAADHEEAVDVASLQGKPQLTFPCSSRPGTSLLMLWRLNINYGILAAFILRLNFGPIQMKWHLR